MSFAGTSFRLTAGSTLVRRHEHPEPVAAQVASVPPPRSSAQAEPGLTVGAAVSEAARQERLAAPKTVPSGTVSTPMPLNPSREDVGPSGESTEAMPTQSEVSDEQLPLFAPNGQLATTATSLAPAKRAGGMTPAAARSRKNTVTIAEDALDVAEGALLVELGRPASLEHFARLARRYDARAAAWHQLAEVQSGHAARAMRLARDGDVRQARAIRRRLGAAK